MIISRDTDAALKKALPLLTGFIIFFRLIPTGISLSGITGIIDKAVSVLIVVCAFLIANKSFKINLFYLVLCLFLLLRVASTFANGQGWVRVAASSVLCLGLVIITSYSLSLNRTGTLKAILCVMSGIVFLNLINVLENHGILSTSFFRGGTDLLENHNGYIPYFLIAIVTGCLLFRERQRIGLLLSAAVFVTAVITYYYEQSITSIIGLTALYIYIFFFQAKLKKVFNIRWYILLNLLVFYVLVVKQLDFEILKTLFERIGKDVTFSDRTYIWRDFFGLIKQSPVIGYGVLGDDVLRLVLSGMYSKRFTSAHNIFLNTVFQTGIIGLILFMGIFVVVVSRFRYIRDDRIRYFFEAVLGVLILMSQFEAYSIGLYLIIISIMYIYTEGDREGEQVDNEQ